MKKIFCLGLSIILTLGLLTCCGKKDENEKLNTSSEEATNSGEESAEPKDIKNLDETSSDEVVTITYSIWGSEERIAYTEESIEAFEAIHPNIKVELLAYDWSTYPEEFAKLMNSNSEADVMQINYDWLDLYSSNGAGFYNLYNSDSIIDLSTINNQVLYYGIRGGKLNAIPIALNTYIPIFNEKVFDNYDLAVPTTYQELIYAAQNMSEDGIYPIAMTRKQLVSLLFTYYEQVTGESVLGKNGALWLKNQGTEAMLTLYKSFYDFDVLYPMDIVEADEVDYTKIGGIYGWLNSASLYETKIEKVGGTAVISDFISTGENSRLGTYVKPASMLAIKLTTDYPVEAATFVDYLVNSKENAQLQLTEKGIPVSTQAEMILMEEGVLNDNINYMGQILLDYNLESMTVEPDVLENSNYIENFVNTLNRYATGVYDLDEARQELIDLEE